MNPGNILSELLPRKARLVLYIVIFLIALVFAAWQASDGNWLVALGSVLASLSSLLSAGNTTAPAIIATAEKLPEVETIVVHENPDLVGH
jgi:hypothetical protein